MWLFQPFAHLALTQTHRHHRAAAAGASLMVAALEDDAGRLFEAQGTAGPGRRHFAHAVAGDGHRLDAAFDQPFGDRHLQGEQGRLGDLGGVEAVLAVLGQAAVQFLEQLEAIELAEGRIQSGQAGAHAGGFLHQGATHAGPLTAIAGIHEYRPTLASKGGHTGRLARRGTVVTLGGQRGEAVRQGDARMIAKRSLTAQGLEVLDQLLQAVGTQQRAVHVMLTAGRQVPGEVVEARGGIVRLRLAQVLGQLARHLSEGLGGAGAQAQRRRLVAVSRRLRYRRLGGTFQKHVGVGAAETEGVDPDHQTAGGLELARLGDDVEIPLVAANLRIQTLDLDGGRHLAVGDHTQRLGQTRHAGGRLQVAHVALDRADRQRA